MTTTTDPRTLIGTAIDLGGKVVAGVRPDQLDGPTPCPDFNVRMLIGHLTGVVRRVEAIGNGLDPFSVPEWVEGVADDGWSAEWAEAAVAARDSWADDAKLDRIVVLPWSQMPGGPTLLGYASEITVHTWDLAVATGQQVAWDEEVLAAYWRS